MILDSRNQQIKLNRRATVAIVGAGPAGMVLARELAKATDVLIIESGGHEHHPDIHALCKGDISGLDYPLTETRARQFGGSSTLWAGYCAAFDAHDFDKRAWVPESGWPFSAETLRPFYLHASQILNIRELNLDARDIIRRTGNNPLLDNEIFTPSAWLFGAPTIRFGHDWRSLFEDTDRITTLTYANVVDLHLSQDCKRVNEIIIRTLCGRQGRIEADLVVLACGGLETPRILLNANSQMRTGVGNSNDLVGRYFMEHPHFTISSLKLTDSRIFESWTRRETYDDGIEFMSSLGITPETQASAGILNGRIHVFRSPQMEDIDMPAVGVFLEQAPNPESRVSLSEDRDALGLRKICLNWQLTDLDWKTYDKISDLIGDGFESLNAAYRVPRLPPALLYSNHHLGTTRMSLDSTTGAVDPDCRVHDMQNLYIIGGSVFPTVSWANPTFTLIALTLRLAQHLQNIIRPSR